MAGLYIHIPFCKQACHYCDFHFSTNTRVKREMTEAIAAEMALQKDYLGKESLETIYFGGGTPSLLDEEELKFLLDRVNEFFDVAKNPEITLEANPDDLGKEKLKMLYRAGINRLSIGIQSFHEEHLTFLNRAHNSREASRCIQDAREAGFDNLSIDLIYAIPAKNDDIWLSDLQTVLELRPGHISSYCLTIEPQTAFGNWLKKGRLKAIDEEFAAHQFELLLQKLKEVGYEQYEISNFSLPGKQSRHNSNYWKQQKYLGVGPSAHSYDGVNRQFNVSNNAKYLKSIANSQVPFELDELTKADCINEYLLISLRTSWGCDLKKLKAEHQFDLQEFHKEYLEKLFKKELAIIKDKHLILTDKGKLLADEISSDLFLL